MKPFSKFVGALSAVVAIVAAAATPEATQFLSAILGAVGLGGYAATVTHAIGVIAIVVTTLSEALHAKPAQ